MFNRSVIMYFPNYIIKEIIPQTRSGNMTIADFLRKRTKGYYPQVLMPYGTSINRIDCIYLQCTIPEYRNIVVWISDKIIKEIPQISYNTIGVRLRIMVGMFRKLLDSGTITSEEFIETVDNVSKNVWDLHWHIINEQLPFVAD